MSYRALYRQYRPATFSEMIGQEHITTILKNQVISGQTAHAYLFSGTRGTGKTSAAKILARAVNCLSPVGGEPCLKCAACQRTAVENADIIELDAASNNGIDDVRDIIDKARLVPLELRRKVYIIDEVHAMSPAAFNGMLKTLEEPPPHVMFILATTEAHKLPATIISRCQRMDFHRLSIPAMVRRMQEVLDSAGAEIEQEGMVAIARAAEGGMRDCLSLADQCISFCGNKVSAEDVYNVLGGMEEGFLFKMADAIVDSDPAAAMALMDRVVDGGRDLKAFLRDLTLHMRALLIARLCGSCCDILDCTQDTMERYIRQAERAGEARLLRANELLLQTESRLKSVTLPRVLIESAIVRIARPEDSTILDDLAERIELLESRLNGAVQPVQAVPVEKPVPITEGVDIPPFDMDEPGVKSPARPKATYELSPGGTVEPKVQQGVQPGPADSAAEWTPKSAWKAVADKLAGIDKSLSVTAVFGKAVRFESGELDVEFDKEVMYKALSSPANLPKVQAAMEEVFPGGRLRMAIAGKSSGSLEERGRELFGSAFRIQE